MAAFSSSSSSSSSSTVRHCLRSSSLQPVACNYRHRSIESWSRSSRHRRVLSAATTQHAVAPLLQRQQQQGLLRSRAGIIVAAGRPRKQQQPQPGPDDEPQLDVDDVMYGTEDMEGEEGLQDHEEDEDEGAEAAGPIGLDDSPRRIVYLDDAEEFDDEDYEFGDEEEDQEEEAEGGGADEELEGWDAALSNFDTAQDAAAPAAPTKEEREAAAARAMVRFEEAEVEGDDGPILEVLPAPVPEQWRPKTFDEQTVELAPADKEALARNRQGYAVFPMANMELLVSELPDGRLCLADAFVLNTFDELFSRPRISDEVPHAPRMFQLLPWEHTNTGDTLKRIDRKVTLMRMYFVGLSNTEPYQVDMKEVFSFDCIERSLVRHKVTTLGENHVDPVLRIREDGIFIEDAARVPGMAFVAEGFAGHPEEQYTDPDKQFNIRDYVRMGMWPEPGLGDEERALLPALAAADEAAQQEAIEERLEELELMEELDDMPDVPAVDMV
ncbi:hypothetical protein COO60DRAFT_1700591 [Scenedesmus sp. NREL 46B-D3]|nr:hypothetical protein COO60DRAFT_1700591 [Scenedesmus sp. NREL 46B-D3]